MVTLHVFYPEGPDVSFDADYYTSKHLPLALDVWGEGVVGATVAMGVGAPGGGSPQYRCVAQVDFASREALEKAMSNPRNAEVAADVANYTNSKPTVQIGRRVR